MLRKLFDVFDRILKHRFWLTALASLIMTGGIHLAAVSQIYAELPSPEESEEQVKSMFPEEIAQVNITADIRDSLRFDPRWQPFVQAVRQDMMEFRWNNGHVRNPIWKRYGRKTYPLLNYYSQSGDYLRQKYAVEGIKELGKPYTTFWLKDQLRNDGDELQSLSFDVDIFPILVKELGLTDTYSCHSNCQANEPETISSLIEAAQKSADSEEISEFNRSVLDFLYKYVDNSPPPQEDHYSYHYESEIELPDWEESQSFNSMTEQDIPTFIDYFKSLSVEQQAYLLISELGPIKEGEISLVGKALLKHIANDDNSPYQVWAIADLDRHGDPEGSSLLKEFLYSDLGRLSEITGFVDRFGPDKINIKNIPVPTSLHPSWYGHNYALLIGITKKYPDSKFVQACREFGDLRGASYFGRELRSDAIRNRIASKTPEQTVEDWIKWLSKYPQHPGADDATHFLARSLQSKGDTVGAVHHWLRLMVLQPGDKDILEIAWPHIRTRLDVGLSVEQLIKLVDSWSSTDIAPLLDYSLAVKQARVHNYTRALELTTNIDLSKMPSYILETYYFNNYGPSAESIQQKMQEFLIEQRQRWTKLKNIQEQNTPESIYYVAADWASLEGWKNGYLPFWEERRITKLPFLNRSVCEYYWICDSELRKLDEMRVSFGLSNSNYIALELYESLLETPDLSSDLREKTLLMNAQALLNQWELFPVVETVAIHPPPTVAGDTKIKKFQQSSNFRKSIDEMVNDDREHYTMYGATSLIHGTEAGLESELLSYKTGSRDNEFGEIMSSIKPDYAKRLNSIIDLLRNEFPNSPYIDDVMLSSYFFLGDKQYLTEIVNDDLRGDRYEEAVFLLNKLGSE